jgi:hypothetical protein
MEVAVPYVYIASPSLHIFAIGTRAVTICGGPTAPSRGGTFASPLPVPPLGFGFGGSSLRSGRRVGLMF